MIIEKSVVSIYYLVIIKVLDRENGEFCDWELIQYRYFKPVSETDVVSEIECPFFSSVVMPVLHHRDEVESSCVVGPCAWRQEAYDFIVPN